METEKYSEEYMNIIGEYAEKSTAEEWSNTEYRKNCFIEAAKKFIKKYGIEAWESLGYC